MTETISNGLVEPRYGGERFKGLLQPSDEVCCLWVLKIRELLGSQRASTITLARVVYAARQQLRGGEWSTLWRSGQIPFSKRKGDMLVTIGRELGNLDEQNLAQLPIPWSVLYEIALLGVATVIRFIAEGIIHSGFSLREAAALRRKKAEEASRSIERVIRRLEEMVRRAGDALSQTRRAACAAALDRVATQLLFIQK